MPDEKKGEVHWLPQPEEQDYPGAADYLSLLESDDVIATIVASLRVAPIQHRKAKDILRASRLVLLPEDNAHVASKTPTFHSNWLMRPGNHASQQQCR